MTNGPLVSVIMPTYNRADKIEVAIESVKAQTYRNIELIVCDDGSLDETETLMGRLYPTVNYVRIPHAGQASARNKGLSLAKGNIIASLDSDDKWHPSFLEVCVGKLESEKLDFVFANWLQQFPNGRDSDFLSRDPFLIPFMRKENDQWHALTSEDLRTLYLRACPSPSSSTVLRKSSIVSGWNEKINISDDWCLFLDMILSGKCRAAFTLEVLWNKYVNNDNIYDGRRRSELLELFHIQDTLVFMDRYKNMMSEKEMKVLNKRCVRGCVELAKHHMIAGFDLQQSIRLIRNSVKMGKRQTMVAIPDVIFTGAGNHLKELMLKLKKFSGKSDLNSTA